MGDLRELRSRAVGANGHRRHRSKPSMASGSDDQLSPRSGTNRPHHARSADASPDSKCPICLDRFENVAFLDRCRHKFCFCCVQEWSKNKAECPLCKQPFHSILHSMTAEHNFKVYTVRPSHTDFANPDGRRFRYRTTLTRERRALAYPRRTSSRRTVSPPDNGILFEGLSNQTTRQRNAEMHQMMRRLASRRQASLEGRSMRQIQEQEIINFRRDLYRSGTRVRSIEDGGRYRDITAEFFRRNPACLHRLVPWLQRELTVLIGSHGSLVNIVQRIILSNVTRYDMESQEFADDLKPFLLHRTVHFVHEFISFARCPFNIEAYDQHANYDCPAPSYEEGSRSDSSIITISPDEADAQEPENNALTAGTGEAPWDDETPGPSYFSSEQVYTALSTSVDTSEISDGEPSANPNELQDELPAQLDMNGDSCDSSDNCIIVGYVKPLAERTPELVELSSDSEESIDGEKNENAESMQPIQYNSFSDTDAIGYASPFSAASRDGSSSYKTNVSLSNKRKTKRSKMNDSNTRESPRSWLQSSPTKSDDDDDYSLSKRRKIEYDEPRSHSRERHGLKSKRKHRSMEKRKRKRDSSRHKHRKDKRKSRTRDKSLSRKRKAHSLSSASTESYNLSRSRSHSSEYRKSRSKSKDSDYYVRDDNYKWECSFDNRNPANDEDESSYRRQTQATDQYSRQSDSPDYRVQPFSERANNRNQRDNRESRYYYYERHRSRSRSSSRSRTSSRGADRVRSEKLTGKRKYKTHHLERGRRESEEASSTKDYNALEKPLPKCRGVYKRARSFSDRQSDPEVQHKKRKKMSRNPSVEIVYEGKTTDGTRHHKKKRKGERKPHKSHVESSPYSSPVVITIDSESDKDTEAPESTECDSTSSWSPTIQQNERETESPSSFLETREYDRVDDLETTDNDSSVATSRKVVEEEMQNIVLQQQEAANGQVLTLTDSGTSFGTTTHHNNIETKTVNHVPDMSVNMLLKLSKLLGCKKNWTPQSKNCNCY